MFAKPLKPATLLGFLAAGLLTSVSPAAAHHSFALFDMTKTLDIEGTVTKFDWTNPHAWIFLNVPGPRNSVEQWIVELPAAGALARDGWNKNFIKPGEKLVVRINPLKSGQKGGSLASFRPEDDQ